MKPETAALMDRVDRFFDCRGSRPECPMPARRPHRLSAETTALMKRVDRFFEGPVPSC